MARPTVIVAGDTYTWTVSSSDYPASDGYSLKVTINSASARVNATTATASNGKDWDVTLTAAQSMQLNSPGRYYLVEVAEYGTGATIVRHTLYSGTVEVKHHVGDTTVPTDVRTHARKVLEAIEAAIEGRATRGQLQSTVIGDRQVQYLAPEELLKWRSFYKMEVAREEAQEKVAQGLDGGNRILTRFSTGSWR